MVKSLHQSLEAKLASVKDPNYDGSDADDGYEGDGLETISTKRGKGSKLKAKTKQAASELSTVEKSTLPSTVVYLGHLPVGFEDHEITVFLNQFGDVKRCRVSRSKKTGRSRGFAFVEFADHDVAKTVAETMSGYFLLEKRLVCHLVPMDKVHELMFAKPSRAVSKASMQKKAMVEVNKRRTVDAMKGITAKLVEREELKRKKLAALGIDFDFPGYGASAYAVTHIHEEKDSVAGTKRQKSSNSEEGAKVSSSEIAKTPKSRESKMKESGERKGEVIESPKAPATDGTQKKSEKLKRKKKRDESEDVVSKARSISDAVEKSGKQSKKNKIEKIPSKSKTPKLATKSSAKKKHNSGQHS